MAHSPLFAYLLIVNSYELFIGLRYTRSRQRTRFISVISLISIVGIALGMTVLVTVLSVFNGFQREVRTRMLSAVAHIQVSDLSELNYMKRVFGKRTREVPLISTKPIYGHTLGASSALNVAAAALMLKNEFVIPTINVDESRVVHGFNHQANRGASRKSHAGVVIAYGMGGQNVALALRRGDR